MRKTIVSILAGAMIAGNVGFANATPSFVLPGIGENGQSCLSVAESISGDQVATTAMLENGTIVRMRSKDLLIMQIDYEREGLTDGIETVGERFSPLRHGGKSEVVYGQTYDWYAYSDAEGNLHRYKLSKLDKRVEEVSVISKMVCCR